MATQQALPNCEGYSDSETLDITWSHVNTSWTHGPKTKPLDPGTLVRFKYTNAIAMIVKVIEGHRFPHEYEARFMNESANSWLEQDEIEVICESR